MEVKRSVWREQFEMLEFRFEDQDALIVLPKERRRGNPWLLKTEYFYAFQDLEHAFVEEGWCLAHIENSNRWGSVDNLDRQARFGSFVIREFQLSPKCVPVGMSCGGLQAVKLAARYPEMVGALYLDAPVINLLSCPFSLGMGSDIDIHAKREALDALGLNMSEMLAYRDHPLDRLKELAAARIPGVLVWGDADTTVPFEENGRYVEKMYRQCGIPLLTDRKQGIAHHPHGPSDPTSVIAFIHEQLDGCR